MSQPPRQRSRPPARGDWGIAVPFFAAAIAIAIVGFWPAMIWHGYTGTGGWKWDIHSTIAELAYFGVAGFIAALVFLGNRSSRPALQNPPPMKAASPGPLPGTRAALPACCHLDAVPVDLFTGERVAWWCEACETRLDADSGRLMRPCCGSAPGTAHQYNCPHLKGAPS